MQKIYKYLDYRQFLADYYNEKKSTTRYFSHRYFAGKAGFKSPIFLKQVIDNERNLTDTMIEKFAAALELNKKESLFFRNLVHFNQAKTPDEKQNYYCYLLSMMDCVDEQKLTADQYLYYNKWYNSVIRELICLYDFKDDYNLIANSVKPAIKPSEVKESITLLLRLNLIKKQKDGTCIETNKAITSGYDIVSLARRSFNSKMIFLAVEANESVPVEKRNISGITMGISRSCYEVLLVELDAFKKRIISIVNKDENGSHVYQLNFQLFPLSEDIKKGEEL